MNGKQRKILMEEVVAYMKIISQNLPVGKQHRVRSVVPP
jgi:hypothetical protein